MPQAFSQLFSALSGANGVGQQVGTIGTGAGAIGNIIQGIQQQQQLGKVNSIENASPTKLASEVASATQPLNAGLQQNVGNVVQANMAERGLSQAPGVFATAESQALAPFYQQNQQTALQLIAQKLGMPLEALQVLMRGQPANLTNAFMKLALGQQQTPQQPGITPPTFGGSSIPGYQGPGTQFDSSTTYADPGAGSSDPTAVFS